MVPRVLFCWVLLSSVLGSGQGPNRFVVRLETTKGNILIECFRDWAPNGADRFWELAGEGFFDENRFWGITVEYAKASPGDILMRIVAKNRSRPAAMSVSR